MTPAAIVITGSAAWLTGMFLAWALVHGSEKLRRQEIAMLTAAEPDKAGSAPVTSITPEADQLAAAA